MAKPLTATKNIAQMSLNNSNTAQLSVRMSVQFLKEHLDDEFVHLFSHSDETAQHLADSFIENGYDESQPVHLAYIEDEDKEVVIDGTVYHMGNHGFTRGSDFTCVRHDENTIVMELKDSEATLAQYPFAFTLRITYTLNGKQLDIHYSITNDNDRVMPFNFGLHPAFNCPMAEGETQAEYHLELNAPETFTTLQGKKLSEGNVLELNRADLEQTILVTAPKTTETKLTNGKHAVTVRAEGYEWLAFWSAKNNAPFVCIEPWHSHSDFEEVKVPFEKREGTLFLDAHQEFTTDYSIIVG